MTRKRLASLFLPALFAAACSPGQPAPNPAATPRAEACDCCPACQDPDCCPPGCCAAAATDQRAQLACCQPGSGCCDTAR